MDINPWDRRDYTSTQTEALQIIAKRTAKVMADFCREFCDYRTETFGDGETTSDVYGGNSVLLRERLTEIEVFARQWGDPFSVVGQIESAEALSDDNRDVWQASNQDC